MMEEALKTYFSEARERLEELEQGLLDIESNPNDSETLNSMFRAAHTIKGSASIFSLDGVVSFTHDVENVLDRVRNSEIPMDRDLVQLMLKCKDNISELIDCASKNIELSTEQVGIQQELLHNLSLYLKAETTDAEPTIDAHDSVQSSGELLAGNSHWHLSLRFEPTVMANGSDPLSYIRFLDTLGERLKVVPILNHLPQFADYDPELCYLGFEIALRSPSISTEILQVFEFIEDDSSITLLPPNAALTKFEALLESVPDDAEMRQAMLDCHSLNLSELASIEAGDLDYTAHAEFIQPARETSKTTEDGSRNSLNLDSASAGTMGRRSTPMASDIVRVDAAKLDSLINLVGELVIAGDSVNLLAQALGETHLREATSNVAKLVEEVRDSALSLRMIQIGSVFSRFNRVVRDVAKELGKDINLSINGSETELDKTLVERITDPLTHLVRNAIDHGIESQEERIKAGKSAVGEVSLNAYHDSGSIVIEVSDDGGGLNRDKIHQKAVERGLLTGSESLSDQDIFNLIFEPGFTTASAVTNLSGRGVGMDVVKRNITALRGTIDLQSRENEGIKVVLRLPLTLAIIDGFLVTVNEDKYVIPLDMVVECVDLRRVEFQATAQRNYVNLRGRVLPFVRLRELFGCAAPSVDKENLVVCEYAGQRAGIVVDGLLGEYQTVIKPLSQMFSKLEGIGGSTILGSGEVALILDIPAAVRAAIRNHTGDIETQVSTCTT